MSEVKRLCPLLSAGYGHEQWCKGYKCAWWVHIKPSMDPREEKNECAIKWLARKRK